MLNHLLKLIPEHRDTLTALNSSIADAKYWQELSSFRHTLLMNLTHANRIKDEKMEHLHALLTQAYKRDAERDKAIIAAADKLTGTTAVIVGNVGEDGCVRDFYQDDLIAKILRNMPGKFVRVTVEEVSQPVQTL